MSRRPTTRGTLTRLARAAHGSTDPGPGQLVRSTGKENWLRDTPPPPASSSAAPPRHRNPIVPVPRSGTSTAHRNGLYGRRTCRLPLKVLERRFGRAVMRRMPGAARRGGCSPFVTDAVCAGKGFPLAKFHLDFRSRHLRVLDVGATGSRVRQRTMVQKVPPRAIPGTLPAPLAVVSRGSRGERGGASGPG